MKARAKLMRSLRKRAESLGVDLGELTDEELERRLAHNSRRLTSWIADSAGTAANQAVAQVSELRAALRELKDRR